MAVARTNKLLMIAILLVVGCVLAITLLAATDYPQPQELSSYDASVEAGSYLATAGNCATCHTAENGAPYAGGLEFVTPFGVLYSTNITSDPNTGIGNWTFQDFYNSMKHGIRPDGSHLYPAFPYTDFARMTDDDIASLYLYFQTVEPVNQAATVNELKFPFNQRELLSGWKALFHSAQTFQPDASQSAEWNRGAYLIEGPGHCGACHTPRNFMGAEKQSLAFTGGTYMDKVKFGYHRQWSGVNLTSHATGLASRSQVDLVLEGGR
jgi:mono/diheme cytochrome c family protein